MAMKSIGMLFVSVLSAYLLVLLDVDSTIRVTDTMSMYVTPTVIIGALSLCLMIIHDRRLKRIILQAQAREEGPDRMAKSAEHEERIEEIRRRTALVRDVVARMSSDIDKLAFAVVAKAAVAGLPVSAIQGKLSNVLNDRIDHIDVDWPKAKQ